MTTAKTNTFELKLGSPTKTPPVTLAASADGNPVIQIVAFTMLPNRKNAIFREQDMPALAQSFVNAPFLRDHNTDTIDARDGTILNASYVGQDLLQDIEITTDRGKEDLRQKRIDRFSISVHVDQAECSICHGDYRTCTHFAGRKYDGKTCQVIFINPEGKETSAVNIPAARGTGIISQFIEDLKPLEKLATLSLSEEEPTMNQIITTSGTGAPPISAPPNAPALLDATQDALAEMRQMLIDAKLAAAGLPAQAEALLRMAINAETTPARVDELIAAQRAALAAVAPSPVRNVQPSIQIVDNATLAAADMQAAIDWHFGHDAARQPHYEWIDLRKLYVDITGDRNFYGQPKPEHTRFAASTATLPAMVANALNKVMLQHYDSLMTYRWFEAITNVLPHDGTTQDIKLVTMDGIATLPTVAEGGTYTEATVGDASETMSFAKKGVYVGVTLEMFQRNQMARLQAIPRALVSAAIRTRSAAIAAIFTTASGTGPTLADDSTVLFHANHGNVATTAFSTAGWAAMRAAIFEQTVPGASSNLALWPTFCLVPIELYDTALVEFGYGTGDVGKPNSGGTAQTVNPYAASRAGDPRPIPIVVPEWTDATDWAAIVDPRIHPVIHMAYAANPGGRSHPMPEIFAVTGENQGLMFTNDIMPLKVRDQFAYGVSTYLGIAKRNVA